jgi:hypothetical protein
LLPAANGYFAPKSAIDPNDPLLGGASTQVPIPMAPPTDAALASSQAPFSHLDADAPAGDYGSVDDVMARGPAFAGPPKDPLLGGASHEPVPASILNMSAPPPQAPPPEPPAPGVPQPKLIATISPGTKGHEVTTAGESQKENIKDANKLRLEGVQSAVKGQDKSQQAIIDAANQGIAEQTARQEAARQTMAKNQVQLDEDQAKINMAINQRAETPMTDYWADKSTGSRVMATLGLAMGAFAASLRGTENGALKMLNADMDRDLKTKQQRYMQEKGQADAKRDAAQNAFNNHVRQFGMAAASDIEAGAQRQILSLQAMKMAATAKRPEIQGQGAQIAQNLKADAKEYEAKALTKYVPPTGPTVKYKDPDIGIDMTRKEALEWRQKNIAAEKSQEGKLAVAALKGGAAGRKQDDTNRRFIAEKMQIADVPGTLTAIEDTKKAMQKSGDSGLGLAGNAIWNHGPVGRKIYKQLYGADAANREQLWQTTVNKTLKAMSGVAVSPSEMTRLQAQLEGAHDAEARKLALEESDKTLRAAQNNIFAGAGPNATAEYKSNLSNEQAPQINFRPAGQAAPEPETEKEEE